MTTIAQNSVAKLSVAFVTVAMLFTLVAPAAKAQTTSEDLAAQIATLMAQIAMLEAQLSGGSTGAGTCVAIQAPLTIGAQSGDVTALQNYLINAGQVIPAGATGYFGSQTQAALAGWQAANGVSPAVGYYGPITKAAIEASCTPSAPTTPTTPDNGDEDEDEDDGPSAPSLGNDSGSIDNVSSVSPDENSINEGQLAGVLAFEVEIEGDLQLNRFDFYLDQTNGSASDDADDYFETASLWVDGDMVAEVDVNDWNEDDYNVAGSGDEFRVRFSGLDLVFEDGDEPEFQLAFEAVGNIDSTDITNALWDVVLDSIRTLDGQGFTTSEGSYASTIAETFDFDMEEVAELDIVESSDNPDATVLEVESDDESTEYDVFVFEIEEREGLDVTVEDMQFTITSSTAGQFDELILSNGSTELGSESVPASGIVTFDDIGLEIDADDIVELTVSAVFNGTDMHAEGSTFSIALTGITDAEDENGNDQGEMDITGDNGTVTSETHELRSTGINVTVNSATTNVTTVDGATNDIVEFTFEVAVKAFGDNAVFINRSAADIVAAAGLSATDVDIEYMIDNTGTALTSVGATIARVGSGSDVTSVTGDAGAYGAAYASEDFFRINRDKTGVFTINISGTNATDSKQVRAALMDIEWTTDVVTATDKDAETAAINSYTFELEENSRTPYKTVN